MVYKLLGVKNLPPVLEAEISAKCALGRRMGKITACTYSWFAPVHKTNAVNKWPCGYGDKKVAAC